MQPIWGILWDDRRLSVCQGVELHDRRTGRTAGDEFLPAIFFTPGRWDVW